MRAESHGNKLFCLKLGFSCASAMAEPVAQPEGGSGVLQPKCSLQQCPPGREGAEQHLGQPG